MNVWRWTSFFVVVLSFEYAAATLGFLTGLFGGHHGVDRSHHNDDNEEYYGWSKGCHCSNEVTSILDKLLISVRAETDAEIGLRSYSLEEYRFGGGKLKKFNDCRKIGPYRCALSNDHVRIFFRLSFPKLFVNFGVSLMENLLGAGSIFFNIIGKTANTIFCKVAIPDVMVTVVVRGEFGGNVRHGLQLESCYLSQVGEISFLGGIFLKHQHRFLPFFKPLIYDVLQDAFHNTVQRGITKHFKKVTVHRRMFQYSYNSSYKEEGRGNFADSNRESQNDARGGGNRQRINSRNDDDGNFADSNRESQNDERGGGYRQRINSRNDDDGNSYSYENYTTSSGKSSDSYYSDEDYDVYEDDDDSDGK